MKSPLRKRLLRELKSEFGKYLVVFVMMAITIAFVSGFLVADGSMIRAYNDSFQKYNIEDGYFRTKKDSAAMPACPRACWSRRCRPRLQTVVWILRSRLVP